MRALRRLLVPTATSISLLAGGAALALFGPTGWVEGEARAKSGYDSLYTYEQTWNTALRLVRVDLGYKVVEKDEKAGYILFEYVDKGTISNASLELLPSERAIKVICQIPKFPSYHEAVVLERLSRKLKEEHGAPVEKPKPPPVVDAGPPPDATPDAP
jgi:hypothetical protein